MTEPEHEQSRGRPAGVDMAAELVSSILLLYLMAHPELPEQTAAWLRRWWLRARYRWSVWSALGSIRGLPETDERDD